MQNVIFTENPNARPDRAYTWTHKDHQFKYPVGAEICWVAKHSKNGNITQSFYKGTVTEHIQTKGGGQYQVAVQCRYYFVKGVCYNDPKVGVRKYLAAKIEPGVLSPSKWEKQIEKVLGYSIDSVQDRHLPNHTSRMDRYKEKLDTLCVTISRTETKETLFKKFTEPRYLNRVLQAGFTPFSVCIFMATKKNVSILERRALLSVKEDLYTFSKNNCHG